MDSRSSNKTDPEKANTKGALFLLLWLLQDEREAKPIRIAPLSEFRGVAWINGDRRQSAGSTYAVCLHCKVVLMAGYISGDPCPVPKQCKLCHRSFSVQDYFQPVYGDPNFNLLCMDYFVFHE